MMTHCTRRNINETIAPQVATRHLSGARGEADANKFGGRRRAAPRYSKALRGNKEKMRNVSGWEMLLDEAVYVASILQKRNGETSPAISDDSDAS